MSLHINSGVKFDGDIHRVYDNLTNLKDTVGSLAKKRFIEKISKNVAAIVDKHILSNDSCFDFDAICLNERRNARYSLYESDSIHERNYDYDYNIDVYLYPHEKEWYGVFSYEKQELFECVMLHPEIYYFNWHENAIDDIKPDDHFSKEVYNKRKSVWKSIFGNPNERYNHKGMKFNIFTTYDLRNLEINVDTIKNHYPSILERSKKQAEIKAWDIFDKKYNTNNSQMHDYIEFLHSDGYKEILKEYTEIFSKVLKEHEEKSNVSQDQ